MNITSESTIISFSDRVLIGFSKLIRVYYSLTMIISVINKLGNSKISVVLNCF